MKEAKQTDGYKTVLINAGFTMSLPITHREHF